MATYVKQGWERYSSPVREAIGLFAIATAVSIILVIIAELFTEENGFFDSVLRKLAEAFTFIAAASLTGAVYVIMSDYKQKAKVAGIPKQEFVVNGDTFELKQFYVKK